MLFLATFCLSLLLLSSLSSSNALIVAAPPAFRALAPTSVATEEQSVNNDSVSIRIRSTREDDIPQVASLLATAAVDDTRYNWVASIECLRRVASFQSLLLLRYQTIREGIKAASKIMQDDEVLQYELLSSADRLQLMWEQDTFRSKVQKAACMSSEPHLWKEYNFALCPQDPRHLQHVMLTAEDVASGAVVGFCEVAMMSGPSTNEDESNAAPTIANLATCPSYRRRGIAAGLLESVSRYVKQYWKEADDLALYVAKENQRAVSLYKKQGFRPKSSSGDDKWYMTVKTNSPGQSAAVA